MYTMSDKLLTNPPITDRVREAMAISLRGCDELLPQDDWLTKLARSEATGVPLRIIGDGPMRAWLEQEYPEVIFSGRRSFEEIGPLAAFLIAALIIPRAVILLRDAVRILMDFTPAGLDLDEVRGHFPAKYWLLEAREVSGYRAVGRRSE